MILTWHIPPMLPGLQWQGPGVSTAALADQLRTEQVAAVVGGGSSSGGGDGGPADWDTLLNRPSSFPPSAHTHAQSEVTGLVAALAALAPKNNPAFTGSVTAPTVAAGTSSTAVATTAFVATALQAIIGMAPADLDTLVEIATRLQSSEGDYAALVGTIAGKLAKDQNLGDLANVAAARTNLGLGSAALQASTAFQAASSNLTTLSGVASTVFGRQLMTLADATAARVALSLGNVNNTADADKPVSTAQQAALNDKADITDTIVSVAASRDLGPSDNGKVLEATAAVTLTVPSTLPARFNCIVAQVAAGQVTIAAGAGATLTFYGGAKTAGTWAELAIRVRDTAGVAVVSGGVA